MEDSKLIILCSECGKQVRIPSDKHIRFSCPTCGHEYEYKNGEEVIKEKRRWGVLILFTVITVAGLFFWLISGNSNDNREQANILSPYDITVEPPETVQPPETFSPPDPIQDQPPTVKKDTAEQLLSDLQQDILEEALDILKDILEQILEEINKEAETGDWEKANKWFEEATETMKHGGKKGETLLKLFEKDLAKTKNNILSKNPTPNILPDPQSIADDKKEGILATEYVTNNTAFVLTLYYTGPTNTIVTVAPGEKKSISLLRGLYNVVAKVSAPSVQEYYGTITYRGYSYISEYYIRTGYY